MVKYGIYCRKNRYEYRKINEIRNKTATKLNRYPTSKELAKEMGITPLNEKQQINFDKKELKILYRNFISMDANKNGLIEPDEFFDVPELRDNPIVQRIINVFDKNGDGNGSSASMNSSGG